MKLKLILKRAALLVLLSTINSQLSTLLAQGTVFTYQGFLTEQGAPVTGSNDLTFTLFNAATSGATVGTSNVVNDLALSNGLFTVALDFGAGAFDGNPRWLQIAARPGDSADPYTNLSPRQRITPVPYAIFAGSSSNLSGTVAAGGLSGTYGNALTFSNAANAIRGTFTGNGAAVSNVNAATLGGVSAAGFWRLDGNNVSPSHILGSTNNRAIELVVNGFTALRLEPNAMALPNVIGGNGNGVAAGVYGAAIGGGFGNGIEINANEAVIAGGALDNIEADAYNAAIGGGSNNRIKTNASVSVIAGGESNTIDTNSNHSFIGGGLLNNLRGNTTFSTIGGGNANTILTGANYGTIGGGKSNTNGATTSVIVGGEGNTVQAGADRSFIGGGLQNITTGALGMVPGGFANSAAGQAFAAGRQAKANHLGAFVWGDSTTADIASTNANSVTMRASGGYRLYSNGGATLGVFLAPNGNSWASLSDRDAKKNFRPLDGRAVLERLAQVPVQKWNYRAEADDAAPHLGPTAQDFKAAFYPGRDDKTISTLEFDGVELAAIQGLNLKLTEELKQKETEIMELKRRLDELEKFILNQKPN